MGKKNDNYYLLTGNDIESKTIYIPYKDSYYKNVKDISDMDIATINLGTKFREILAETNPNTELARKFYIAKFPYAQGVKIFKPVEVTSDNFKTQNIIDDFRDIAEERNYNYHNDLKLDNVNGTRLINFAYDLLNDLNYSQKREIMGRSSIMGKKIKENYGNNQYLFEEQIANYTQLRNLLINYLDIKSGKVIPSSGELARMADSLEYIDGLYPEESENIKRALEEYKAALLKAKDEEEKRKAEEELKKQTEAQFSQMNLYDMFPSSELAFLKYKK